MADAAESAGAIRQCTGCGATVVFEHGSLSTACSYCDSPMVDESRAMSAVDAVVPFRIPKRGALDRLRIYLADRRWAPPELRTLRVHGHGLRGVLVPFWVYEGIVRSQYRAKIGLHWVRTERYRDKDGETRTREVQETEWFPLVGTAARQIVDHVVSASVGLPESEAKALEPFDLGWATSFDPRLLSGFAAELASIATADADQTAVAELREREGARIQATLLPGDRNRLDWITSDIEVHGRRLVLLPVWIATYRHGDRVLRLVVNGQTGKVAGRVPISWLVVAILVGSILAVVGVALLLWWLGGSR